MPEDQPATDPPPHPAATAPATGAPPAAPARPPAGWRWKKWASTGALAAAALALVLLWMRPATVDVETLAVSLGPLSVGVDAQGRTRAMLRYTVAAPVSGRLMRTSLQEGDRVLQGAVLARIAPPPADARSTATARAEIAAAQARQRQADAARAEADSHLKAAKRELVRRSALYAQGFIGAEARDAYAQAVQVAALRLDLAQAALAAAAAEVRSARTQLLGAGTGAGAGVGAAAAAIDIRAPVDGLVLKVHEESERVLAAGSPLFDLSKGQALELVVDVLTQDAVQVRPGAPMRVTGWGGSAVLAGQVRHVAPGAFTKVSTLGVEEQRVNVIGDLVHTPPALGAGYRVEVLIETWAADRVLRVPTGALFRRASSWHAFVVQAGRAQLRALELGQRNADFAEVRAGLVAGDRVILYPSGLVADGVQVAARTAGAAGTAGTAGAAATR